jgi:uncharacterized repeat protein (TIGR03987 family)
MTPFTGFAIVLITLALVLYSIATWRNWRLKLLTTGHVILLWLAVIADTLATRMMAAYSTASRLSMHLVIGYAAVAMMAILTLVGTWAKSADREAVLHNFHRYLLPVWILWVLSYAAGVWIGIVSLP